LDEPLFLFSQFLHSLSVVLQIIIAFGLGIPTPFRLPSMSQKRLPGLERLSALVQQARTSAQLLMIVLADVDMLDEHVNRARAWQARAVQVKHHTNQYMQTFLQILCYIL
jgi:hypothetical protein